MAEKALRTNYDDIVDVLYVTAGAARPYSYEEDEDGLVWRCSSTGRVFGVTIFDFHEYWSSRADFLARQIAEKLHVPEEKARDALNA